MFIDLSAFWHRGSLRVILAIALLLLLLLIQAGLLGQTLWLGLRLLHPPVVSVAPFSLPSLSNTAESTYVFGDPSARLQNASAAQMGIELVGIIGNGRHARALIALKGNATKTYRVGDNLPNGLRVQSIHDGGVMLAGEEGLEQLMLPVQPLDWSKISKPQGLY